MVERICGDLAARGLTCWMDKASIPGSAVWRRSVVDGIRSSQGVLFFASANSFGSAHVARELTIASEQSKPILPVHLDTTRPSGEFEYLLAGIQWVRYEGSRQSESVDAILQSLEPGASPPGVGRSPSLPASVGYGRVRVPVVAWIVGLVVLAAIGYRVFWPVGTVPPSEPKAGSGGPSGPVPGTIDPIPAPVPHAKPPPAQAVLPPPYPTSLQVVVQHVWTSPPGRPEVPSNQVSPYETPVTTNLANPPRVTNELPAKPLASGGGLFPEVNPGRTNRAPNGPVQGKQAGVGTSAVPRRIQPALRLEEANIQSSDTNHARRRP